MAFRPTPQLRALAAAQDGLVTRRQCLDAGLTRGQIDWLGRSTGHGQRVLPRVYSLTSGPLNRRQQLVASLLYAGDGAQLTGITTLEVMQFRYVPNDPRVHVLVHSARRVESTGFVIVHRTERVLAPHRVGGLPVTPPARAAVDACWSMASVRDATAVLAEAVQRRLCTVEMLSSELAAGHSAGSAVPRRAVALLQSQAVSAPEQDLIGLLRRSAVLPEPAVNLSLDVGGRTVVPDLCGPDARLIVEVDSIAHHTLGPDAERTSRRRAMLTAAGWTVLSISPQRIRTDPDGVLREIEAAYLACIARAIV